MKPTADDSATCALYEYAHQRIESSLERHQKYNICMPDKARTEFEQITIGQPHPTPTVERSLEGKRHLGGQAKPQASCTLRWHMSRWFGPLETHEVVDENTM